MAFPPFLVKQLYRCDSVVISSFVRTGYTTRRWGWLLGKIGFSITHHYRNGSTSGLTPGQTYDDDDDKTLINFTIFMQYTLISRCMTLYIAFGIIRGSWNALPADTAIHLYYITILLSYGTTFVNAVRRWPKRRYAAHTCTSVNVVLPVLATPRHRFNRCLKCSANNLYTNTNKKTKGRLLYDTGHCNQ